VVENGDTREFGRAFIDIKDNSKIFEGIWNKGDKKQVWMSHGDRVEKIPNGFKVTASSSGAPYAVISNEEKDFYGVQFHPEVVHTPDGAKLIENFVCKICNCKSDWSMEAFRETKIKEIKEQVGDNTVICGLSGGVDSSVVAAILDEAIGDKLVCVLVNHGMMRLNETKEIEELFDSHFKAKLIVKDASDLFLGKLKNVVDPEEKRKIIGATFIDVFEKEANKIKDAKFLAQGTLYPDVIESVSFTGGPSVTIKSQHNVGGLPEKMNLELVDPLRELFKDEVRKLGLELGLPHSLIGRHPFPGPGLAIRIPGQPLTKEKLDILRKADDIYIKEIKKAGLYDEIWQAFSVLLPVKTVGVMGDSRSYDYALALRAVTSTDGMTADFYHYDYEFLSKVSNKIINQVKGINRVTYDITSKPPGTIEWE
jgi:GMP synthase (glutamine-hydrolysing)